MRFHPDHHGHTPRDAAALLAAGIDPADTQPRERLVPCLTCGAATMHTAAHCDTHWVPPVFARLAAAGAR